jgi:Mitochondrial carrier protein
MTTEEITKKTYRRVANPTIVSAIAGIVGMSMGKFLMHPVDTVKAKLQVISMPSIHSGMPLDEPISKGFLSGGRSLIMKVVRDTIHAEGMHGLYRGFGIHVGGSIPAGALYYGSYEMFKKFTLQYPFLQ